MPFVKGQSGNPGGRPAGRPNHATQEIRALSRALFDREYWTRIREQLHAGVLPPVIHSKLLAYAYGEPQQERSGNSGIHIAIGFLRTAPDITVADATPADVTSPTRVALSGGE